MCLNLTQNFNPELYFTSFHSFKWTFCSEIVQPEKWSLKGKLKTFWFKCFRGIFSEIGGNLSEKTELWQFVSQESESLSLMMKRLPVESSSHKTFTIICTSTASVCFYIKSKICCRNLNCKKNNKKKKHLQESKSTSHQPSEYLNL